MDLDQHIHAQRLGQQPEIPQLDDIEDGGDEQDGVGADDTGLLDLQGIDDEILAQHRQFDRLAHQRNVGEGPLERNRHR